VFDKNVVEEIVYGTNLFNSIKNMDIELVRIISFINDGWLMINLGLINIPCFLGILTLLAMNEKGTPDMTTRISWDGIGVQLSWHDCLKLYMVGPPKVVFVG
jgi:hypothetical protein